MLSVNSSVTLVVFMITGGMTSGVHQTKTAYLRTKACTIKTRIKEPPFSGPGWQRFLDYGHLRGYFAQTLGGGGVMWSNYCQKSLLVGVQSGKGHICFTKPFLLKTDCEISGFPLGSIYNKEHFIFIENPTL